MLFSTPMDARRQKQLLAAGAAVATLLVGRALLRRWRRWDLAGRTILVSGGSRGLGLIIARELVRQGARVAISGRDEQTLERARAELERTGVAIAVRADVTKQADVDRMVREVQARLGPIDAVINNAGAIAVGPVEVMDLQDYQDAMDTNFWGPLYVTLAVLPEMRRRRAGRIVNVASIGGKISVPHLVPYSASKFALVGLSEGLRAELARDGIQVTTVCPGLMRTGSPRHALFKGRHQAEYAWFSISDSLPGISMDAERAARQIVSALRYGTAETVLSVPAKLGAKVHDLFPGFTADMLGLVNRLLPAADGEAPRTRKKGEQSASAVSPSWLTQLGDRAARRFNQGD